MLVRLLARYPAAEKTHLDIACGTGIALRFFQDRQWFSVGIDGSLTMLQRARTRARRVIAADVRALPLRRTFSRITCLYDSLNHLKGRVDLVAAFRAVRQLMTADSLFFFDMNHPDIYPEIWGMKEPFVASGPGYHLEIATSYRRRDAIGLALVTGWAVLPSGEKAAIRERHEQRAYSEREIVEALGEAGLQVAEILEFDPFHERASLEAAGVKLFFVCRRSIS